MKFIITENNLKSFINKKLGVDLTGKIKMYTSSYDIPKKFFAGPYFGIEEFNKLLNNFGPFFGVETQDGKEILLQDRGKFYLGLSEDHDVMKENDILKELGLDVLGVRVSKILDLYFDENEI